MGYRSFIGFRNEEFDEAREIVECIVDKAEKLLKHFDKAEREMGDDEEEGNRGYRRGYRQDSYDGNRDWRDDDGYRGYRRRDSNGRYR